MIDRTSATPVGPLKGITAEQWQLVKDLFRPIQPTEVTSQEEVA